MIYVFNQLSFYITMSQGKMSNFRLYRVDKGTNQEILTRRQTQFAEYCQRVTDTEKLVQNINNSWSIARVAKECPPPDWQAVFEEAQSEIAHISRLIEEQEKIHGSIVPQKRDIFRAFYLTPLSRCRIIIIGQDPYYQMLNNGYPRAIGLSFSLRPHDTVTVSLRNIYKELQREDPDFIIPNHGDLSYWASQGVLLLNMSLSTIPNKANAHKGLWNGFIDIVIKHILKEVKKPIVMLWGREAQQLVVNVPSIKKAEILECPHPATRNFHDPFIGNNHFLKANWYLQQAGLDIIDWQLPVRG